MLHAPLTDILCERGQYEKTIIEQIKKAYDQNNQAKVFVLVGKLLYEVPGAVGRTDTVSLVLCRESYTRFELVQLLH